MSGGGGDDVRIRVGGHDDEVFRHYGNADSPAGPNHKASRSMEEEDDDAEEEEEEDAGSDDYGEEDDEGFARKPLMHPRKRLRSSESLSSYPPPLHPHPHSHRCCAHHRHVIWPIVYLFLFIGGLAVFVWLVIYVLKAYSAGLMIATTQHGGNGGGTGNSRGLVGCDHVTVEDVWVLGLPKLMTESAIRMLDVNEDGHLDVVMGFATGGEGYNAPSIVCDIYFNGSHPCLGGLMVVDGVTGREIWRHYTPHEIFAVSCERDLNLDGKTDCLIAGRVGVFQAVDMSGGGRMLWNFSHTERDSIMNVYTAQYLPDLDADGVPEILNIHGGDPFGEPGSKTRMPGKIFIFSGLTGDVLRWVTVPDGRESYYSPVLYQHADGTNIVLFGTGGETHSGSLWYIKLMDLYEGRIDKAVAIFSDRHKGIMTPPVLLDLTGDGVMDIIFASYNSTALALNGQTYEKIWNFTYPWSETYATPAAGYFNDDDVPDFMLHWQYGPGFPIYFHSVTTIVDGRNGRPLVNPYVKDTVGVQTSPLVVSMEGHGNDAFLYWISDCWGHEGKGDSFSFVKGTNVHEQSRSDFCRLRFKTHGYSKLYALTSSMKAPGATLYNSDERGGVEHASWVNSTEEAIRFLRLHPEHLPEYIQWQHWVDNQRRKLAQKSADGVSEGTGDDSMSLLRLKQLLMPLLQESDDGDYDYERGYVAPPDDDALESVLLPGEKDSLASLLEPAEYLNTRNNGRGGQYGSYRDSPLPYAANDIDDGGVDIRTRGDGYAWKDNTNTYPRFNPQQRPFPYNQRDNYVNSYNPERSTSYYNSNSDPLKNNMDYLTAAFSGPDAEALYEEITKMMKELSETERKLKNKNKNRNQPDTIRSDSLTQTQDKVSNTDNSNKDPTPKSQVNVASDAQPQSDPSNIEDTPVNNLPSYTYDDPSSSRDNVQPYSQAATSNEDETIARTYNETKKKKRKRRRRKKRHVGQHDGDGLQRHISTGTIAPTSLPPEHPDHDHSVDVIFATYWFYPAKTEAILPEDQQCIDNMMKIQTIRFDPNSRYYGMDNDAYEHAVSHECLERSGHLPQDDQTYESQKSYNPYNVHMGQMTLYRLRMTCRCSHISKGQRCAKVLPFTQQQWPAYMGAHSDSHWKDRQHGR